MSTIRGFAVSVATAMLVALSVVAQRPTNEHVPQWQIDAGGKQAFDAASVKPSKSSVGGHSNFGQSGGHLTMVDVALLGLVAQAYKFTNLSDATNMIFGLPEWARSAQFDIEAEAPGNPTVDQKRLMLQSLLSDRFHLAAHWEKRRLPVYAAVLINPGKVGPQLRPHEDDTECKATSDGGTGAPSSQESISGTSSSSSESPAEAAAALLRQYPCGRVAGGLLVANDHDRIWTGGRKLDMATIATSIGGVEATDRPVVDGTGLSGLFDFTVEWSHQLQALSVNPEPDVSGMLSLPMRFELNWGSNWKRRSAQSMSSSSITSKRRRPTRSWYHPSQLLWPMEQTHVHRLAENVPLNGLHDVGARLKRIGAGLHVNRCI
jgi:bla regulator protein blaR1